MYLSFGVGERRRPYCKILELEDQICKVFISDVHIKRRCQKQIYQFFPEMFNEPVEQQPEVNTDVLRQLTDMGFPENRARKALILNG